MKVSLDKRLEPTAKVVSVLRLHLDTKALGDVGSV